MSERRRYYRVLARLVGEEASLEAVPVALPEYADLANNSASEQTITPGKGLAVQVCGSSQLRPCNVGYRKPCRIQCAQAASTNHTQLV